MFTIARQRTLMGFLQGSLLTILYLTNKTASASPFFISMLMVSIFIPMLIVQSLGMVRTKTIFIWAASATLVLLGISYYAIFRQAILHVSLFDLGEQIVLTSIALFIAQSLILASAHDKRIIAQYSTYFDIAWKLGIQVVFTTVFIGFFWLLLCLGANLFNIIHLNFFKEIISSTWFSITATTMVIAIALHISDVKVTLIRSIRTLSLVLLFWLLPLITGIIGLFLLSVTFTGLTPLWQTGYASTLLLLSASILIILINSAYQDGMNLLTKMQSTIVSLACCLLMPLIIFAVYALVLRVQQYGWSVSRIYAAFYIFMVLVYGFGYLIAVFNARKRFKWIETSNIANSFLMLALYLSLLSPLADPARLMVANQISRLQTGKISVDQFDFESLRLRGLRFGEKALNVLQHNWQGPDKNRVRIQAKAALAIKRMEVSPLSSEEKKQLIIVHTKNGKLPKSFLKQNWDMMKASPFPFIPDCLNRGSRACHAWIVQGQDKLPIILILDYYLIGFQQDKNKAWSAIGYWDLSHACKGKMQDLMQGKFKMVAPKPIQSDIEIMGWRTQFVPINHCE